MENKIRTVFLLLILFFMIGVMPKIESAKAENKTFYIQFDGAIEGTDTIIRDGNRYTFVADVHGSLVVQKDNVVIDGAGYCINGANNSFDPSSEKIGILLDARNNVTVCNLTVQHFDYAFLLNSSSSNQIFQNNITKNNVAIMINSSSNNKICDNQIDDNFEGISTFQSSGTYLSDNKLTRNRNVGISLNVASISSTNHDLVTVSNCAIDNNGIGIKLINSVNNSHQFLIIDCNITNNDVGIYLESSFVCINFNNIENNGVGIQLAAASDNEIDHNNFINNSKQIYDISMSHPEIPFSINTWTEGDTGNYWSDYDGTGETPYNIDQNNQDLFPARKIFQVPHQSGPRDSNDPNSFNFFWLLITMIAIAGGAVFFYFYFTRKIKKSIKIVL